MGLWRCGVLLLNEWFFTRSAGIRNGQHCAIICPSCRRCARPDFFGIRLSSGALLLVALLALACSDGMRAMLPGRRGVIWRFYSPVCLHSHHRSLTTGGLACIYMRACHRAVAGRSSFGRGRARKPPCPGAALPASPRPSVIDLHDGFIVRYSSPRNNDMYLTALDVRQFAEIIRNLCDGRSRGAVGYLANVPVIQLEGLMMTSSISTTSAAKRCAGRLKQYEVRYYISLPWRASGCRWLLFRGSRRRQGRILLSCGRTSARRRLRSSAWRLVNDVFDMQ